MLSGLDPARPLVDRFGTRSFKLTRDDAHTVQVVHTNAGMLGEEAQIGHADFCINGGRVQPSCKGHRLRKSLLRALGTFNALGRTIDHS